MESLLSASGLTPAAASPATDSLSPLQPTGAMDSLSAEKEDKLSMLVVDRTGFSTFIGRRDLQVRTSVASSHNLWCDRFIVGLFVLLAVWVTVGLRQDRQHRTF